MLMVHGVVVGWLITSHIYICEVGLLYVSQCKKQLIVSDIPYSGKVWRIDSFQTFGKRKFGELIDQPIDY